MIQKNPQMGQVINQIQNSQNPQAMMSQMFGNNPAFQRAMEVANGKSPQELEKFISNMMNNNIK